ncbi:PIN domain-containing protein [Acinetobacter sp. 3657]|uniref:PIN domain-containing protein n=1 Tax=Acinetobacter sp. 3657 TaxID=2817764 RepID=UPI00285C846F|nr:tRNA(fMet)-specific endonuclease VapC [Prolinoborus sp. 3657]
MEYLLDTNIVSYLLQGAASNKLKNKLMLTHPDSVFISQITHAEIIYGLEKGGNIPQHIERVNSLLETLNILDWDERCVPTYAKIRNELRLQGIAVQSMDLLIGSHALAHNLTLISNDHIFEHFKQFNLMVENWQS